MIKISKKLGFQGWVEFKDAYLEEANYLNSLFCILILIYRSSNQDSIRGNKKKSCKIRRIMITYISVTLKDKRDMAPWSSG